MRLFGNKQTKTLKPYSYDSHVQEFNLKKLKEKMGDSYIMHPDYDLSKHPKHDFWRTSRRS